MDVNPDRLNAFMGKMLGDVGAAMNASLMLIGDKLGLYKTLAAKGPLTSTELAQATKTSERYIREWLAAQAASGYVDYDAASGKFSMTPEQTRRRACPSTIEQPSGWHRGRMQRTAESLRCRSSGRIGRKAPAVQR